MQGHNICHHRHPGDPRNQASNGDLRLRPVACQQHARRGEKIRIEGVQELERGPTHRLLQMLKWLALLLQQPQQMTGIGVAGMIAGRDNTSTITLRIR